MRAGIDDRRSMRLRSGIKVLQYESSMDTTRLHAVFLLAYARAHINNGLPPT